MASKSIDIIISTILKKTGIDAARAAMKDLATTVGKNLTNIKSGFDLVSESVGKFVSAMSKGMEFERMTVQFKSLTGSMETAKAHMKDLQDLGRTPPFSLEEFAAASQAMMKMTGGAIGYKDILEKVGDVAAATGNNIANMGAAVGRAYAFIRDGAPIMSAVEQLRTMGVVTQADVVAMTELQKAGADNGKLWNIVSSALSKYNGAMADSEKTTKGVVDAIQGEVTVALTEFSSVISETAKPELEGLLDFIKRFNEDGTIEDWADSVVSSLNGIKEAASAVLGPLSKVWGFVKGGWEATGQAIGNAVGALQGGGSVKDAANGALSGFKQGWVDGFDADGANAAYSESRAEKRRKKRAEQSAKQGAEAKRRVEEDLARAQEVTNRKKAEDKAKSEAEAAKKAESERLKVVEAERKAREKMEADLHKQRVDYAKSEVDAARSKQASVEGVVSSAKTEFDKAFAMYRSEDKGAAAIAEERDYAKDYKQLQKDAARYGGKWRIDELSTLIAAGDTKGQAAKLEEWRKSSSFTPEVESMVRAAAADNTRTTAEEELRKISNNTQDLAKKLDELLQAK